MDEMRSSLTILFMFQAFCSVGIMDRGLIVSCRESLIGYGQISMTYSHACIWIKTICCPSCPLNGNHEFDKKMKFLLGGPVRSESERGNLYPVGQSSVTEKENSGWVSWSSVTTESGTGNSCWVGQSSMTESGTRSVGWVGQSSVTGFGTGNPCWLGQSSVAESGTRNLHWVGQSSMTESRTRNLFGGGGVSHQ